MNNLILNLEAEFSFKGSWCVFEEWIEIIALPPVGTLMNFDPDSGHLDGKKIVEYYWSEKSGLTAILEHQSCSELEDDDFLAWMTANGWQRSLHGTTEQKPGVTR